MYRLIKKRIPPLFRVGVICCEKVFELSIRQPRRAKGELSMRCALALCFASPWHNWARFGGTRGKPYLCLGKKRKGAGLSSFRVFGANYPIWAGKIIL